MTCFCKELSVNCFGKRDPHIPGDEILTNVTVVCEAVQGDVWPMSGVMRITEPAGCAWAEASGLQAVKCTARLTGPLFSHFQTYAHPCIYMFMHTPIYIYIYIQTTYMLCLHIYVIYIYTHMFHTGIYVVHSALYKYKCKGIMYFFILTCCISCISQFYILF